MEIHTNFMCNACWSRKLKISLKYSECVFMVLRCCFRQWVVGTHIIQYFQHLDYKIKFMYVNMHIFAVATTEGCTDYQLIIVFKFALNKYFKRK